MSRVVFGCDIAEDGSTGTVVAMQNIDGIMHVLSTHNHEGPTYEETMKWATDLMNNYQPLAVPPHLRSVPDARD